MSGADERPAWSLPVSLLPGVAGKRAALLRKLGIETWFDLLSWFPRSFEDWSDLTRLEDLADGCEQTFLATVARKPSVIRKGRLSMLRTVLSGDGQKISAIWFNQPYLAERLICGATYRFRGKVRRSGRVFDVTNPAFEPEGAGEAAPQPIRPVYPLTQGLSQGVMRAMILNVLPRLAGQLPEPLPAWVRREHQLCAVDFAYNRIHQPEGLEQAEICRRRLVFEELFLLQAGLRLLRSQARGQARGVPLRLDAAATRRLQEAAGGLPFELTGAQRRVWREIQADLESGRPMNRLVQGDVGSGKTVLAALAMLQCALCGSQAVLMAPTSILARQHHQTLCRLLGSAGGEIALLSGATPASERKKIIAGLATGSIRLLVGTHALLEDPVRLSSLALAVTDEQHRFGVRQRIRLGSPVRGDDAGDGAGVGGTRLPGSPAKPQLPQPHILVMSATPIPRTLGLILYGDLDLSLIDELPAGRKPVETYTAASGDRERIDALIRRFVQDGRQAYVVCPMIEEEAESDLQSAVAAYNRLSQTAFPDLAVSLLHGAMRQAAKDQVMDRFLAGEIQILVSTTVIEVGIDNPNAALMIIENAERFGLAQLHQLRGRIGRAGHRSICVLLSDSEDELARERLKQLCHAADGFAVAEKDLELRGPGDFFGTRQHGLPALRIANLYRDRDLLREVQACLDKLFAQDPALDHPEHFPVRTALQARYSGILQPVGL
jgi:ATP-dependent DNA helicase RecG